MSSARGRARLVAFKALYAMDIGKQTAEEGLDCALEESKLSDKGQEYARSLVDGACAKMAELDKCLSPLLKGYTLDRLAAVDRTLLRLGAYEVLFEEDMPAGVAINEAVDMAKQYSTEESGAFVNGVLGELARQDPSSSQLRL